MSVRQDPVAIVTHVSEATFSSLGVSPQVTLRLGLVNATGRPLTVVTRNGLRLVVPSRINRGERCIYFKEGFELIPDASFALNMDDAPFSTEPSTAQRLFDNLNQRRANPMTPRRMHEADTHTQLSLTSLIEAGGTVYIRSLDVVVSIHANRSVIHHPYSQQGVREGMRGLEIDDASLRLAFYLVDNRQSLGDRYMNVNGRIFRVPVRHRPEADDGFYAVHPLPSTTGGVSTEYQVIYLTVDEAEKAYQLYRTPEEAITYGFSKEVVERDNQIRKMKQQEQQEHREESKYERQERERATSERIEAEKREADNRAAVRRDIVDILKFVSAIVITTTGFCATVLKLKKG